MIHAPPYYWFEPMSKNWPSKYFLMFNLKYDKFNAISNYVF